MSFEEISELRCGNLRRYYALFDSKGLQHLAEAFANPIGERGFRLKHSWKDLIFSSPYNWQKGVA